MFSLVNLSQRSQLVLSGLVVCTLNYLFQIPLQVQLVVFALGILITGIPHGAMDHLLYFKQHPDGKPVYKWIRFSLFYLGYALLYGLLWTIQIQLAILVFIGISAYHFGELDLKEILVRSSVAERLIATSYGLLFLVNYLLFRWPEVNEILSGFPGFNIQQLSFLNEWYSIKYLLISTSAIIIIMLLVCYYLVYQKPLRQLFYHLLPLAFVCFITYQLPIFLGFGFYFSAWHSMLSITEIKAALGWSDQSWVFALKKTWLTNLAAFIFIGTMFFFFYGDLNRIIAVLFMSIAVLTAPHIQVISSMLSAKTASDKT